ncbi:purine and uridine phosphorylase [Annulohypoxylon moriforme]|nr:purine and uridine phosphorylase [Annulohypoxylon moriforme]
MRQLDPEVYQVAWIAPLEIEALAAWHMMDEQHEGRFPLESGDDYVYYAGSMCGLNVIIATFPAGHIYGTGSAGALAGQVKKFFPKLWFGLLVGVAAGLPNHSKTPLRDIRLGDVLVALPRGETAGLIAYDLRKETEAGPQLLKSGHALATTAPNIRAAIGSLKRFAPNETKYFLPYYEKMKNEEYELEEYGTTTFIDPGQDQDRLYEMLNGVENLLERPPRPAPKRTRVWYGAIGSGEKLLKNAQIRDELRDTYNIIGLEMEATGTMNTIPVGVIRGVCDYGDEHKNKDWQPYAAAMAAAYAKAVLAEMGHGTTKSNVTDGQRQAYEMSSAMNQPNGNGKSTTYSTFNGRGIQISDGNPTFRDVTIN